MSSRIISVRLPVSLAEELAVFCAAWDQCPSGVMRAAVRYMLGQPGLHPDLCDRPAPPLTVDFRTHEQQQAWERYQRELETFPWPISSLKATWRDKKTRDGYKYAACYYCGSLLQKEPDA